MKHQSLSAAGCRIFAFVTFFGLALIFETVAISHAAELPEGFPEVSVTCDSTSQTAGDLSSDPTLDGGWYRPRRDKTSAAVSPLVGGIQCPEALWAVDLSDNGMWLEITPGTGNLALELTTVPQGDFWWAMNQHEAWGAVIDLNGDGNFQAEDSNCCEKAGDFLDSVDGYERITCDAFANGPASDPQVDDPGSCFMHRWNGSVWEEVWKSAPLPEMYSWTGGRLKPVVADMDADGELEVAVSPWFQVHILDLATGTLEYSGVYTDQEAENGMSGRPYGWQGAFNLDDDPRLEVVIIADFLPTIQVMGWNEQGEFVQLWDRIIEPYIRVNEKILMSVPFSVVDVTGDGTPEVLVSVFNETGDNRWHLLVLDGGTGSEVVNLPDRYLAGSWDLNNDGVFELLINETSGQLIRQSAHATIGSVVGGTFRVIDRIPGEGFAWSRIKSFPPNINSGTTLFKRHPTILEDWQDKNDVFVTKTTLQNGNTRLTLRYFDGNAIQSLGTVSGPNLSVQGSKKRDGSDSFLVRSTFGVDQADGIVLDGLQVAGLHAARIGRGGGPDVAGASLSTGTIVLPRTGDTSLVVTEGFGETIRAFSTPIGEHQPVHDWTNAGRGMIAQSGLVALGPNAMASISAYDPEGNENWRIAAAHTSAQSGSGAMSVYEQNGTVLWEREFEVRPDPPLWNLSGVTHWMGGNFRNETAQDLYVVTRRSNMHTDTGYLLNGMTGEIIWRNDGNAVSDDCPRNLRFGPTAYQTALFDWDGDRLDDLTDFANATMVVYSGLDGSVSYNQSGQYPCHNSLFDPELFYNNGIGQVVENGQGVPGFLVGGNSATMASLDAEGRMRWNTGPYTGLSDAIWPQTADLDGDGAPEIVVLSHCGTPGSEIRSYDLLDGTLRWSMPNQEICEWPGVHAPAAGDIDGDGRDEVLFTNKNTLTALAEEDGSPVIRWVATLGEDTWVHELGSPVIADVNGLGHPEILVNTADGRLYSLGVENTQPVFQSSGLSGTWYDPDSNGQGFNFQMTELGLLVFYFGHKDPNKRSAGNLWLISSLAPDQIQFNKPVELTLYERPNGAFGNPNVEGTDNSIVEWGKLTIEFSHCSTGRATLDGKDGKQEFNLARLAPVDGVECTDGALASSISAVSGTWFEPATDGQGFNLQLTPFGLFGYFYGYSAPADGAVTGSPQWLISELLRGSIMLGESYEVAMLNAKNGSFTSPNPTLTEWGTMTLKFDSCKTGSATMSGVDGETTMALQILAPIAGLACE